MTLFSKPTSVLDWVKFAVMAFAAVMLFSWIAGQCRDWRAPKPPPTPAVVPGYVDQGTPAPGPVNEAPTQELCPCIAVPKLTKEQILAEAKLAGLVLVDKPAPAGARKKQPAAETDESAIVGTEPAPVAASLDDSGPPALGELTYPMLYAKQRFGPGPAGDWITVWAWQLAPGERIQLQTVWDPYQPPPLAAPCPPSGGWLGNEARWEKTVGAGLAGTPEGSGYAGLLGIGYRGLRTGHLTWGVDGIAVPAMIDGKLTGFGIVAATTHF